MDPAELHKVFKQIDVDGSGSIDVTELGEAMRWLGVKSTPGAVKRILQVIDKDGNGTIEFDEFVTFFATVKDKEELKQLLNKTSRRFQDYKSESLSDPGFGNRYRVPPSIKARASCEGHNEVVEAVTFASGNTFVSGSLDACLKVWDFATGKLLRSTELPQAVYSLCTLDEKTTLVGLGSGEPGVVLYEAETGTLRPGAGLTGHQNSSVFGLAVETQRKTIATGTRSGLVMLHDGATLKTLTTVDDKAGVIQGLDWSPSGALLNYSGYSGEIKIFDVRANQAVATIEEAASSGVVFESLWRGETEILSSGDDCCAKRWDLRRLDDGPVTAYLGHTSAVRAMSMSSDGHTLLTAALDGSVRVWMLDEMERIDHHLNAASAEDKQKWTEIKAEREKLDGLQAHFALTHHHQAVRDMAVRPASAGQLQVVTASADQSLAVFQFEVPSRVESWQTRL